VVVTASVVIGVVVGAMGALLTRFSEHVHGECVLIDFVNNYWKAWLTISNRNGFVI